VKRIELLRLVRSKARAGQLDLTLLRQGAAHEIWQVGDVVFSVPRHIELTIGVERAIKRDLETVLGRDWWQQ
jgi:hypothetical protein